VNDEPVARVAAALEAAGERATYVRVEVIDLRAVLQIIRAQRHLIDALAGEPQEGLSN
jgi:hypothetical protein